MQAPVDKLIKPIAAQEPDRDGTPPPSLTLSDDYKQHTNHRPARVKFILVRPLMMFQVKVADARVERMPEDSMNSVFQRKPKDVTDSQQSDCPDCG
jgi:hypothetical protein